MTELDEVIEQTPPVGSSNQGGVLDLIQEEASKLASNHSVYIRVKGYEKSGMHIRYRLPTSGKELDDIARRVERVDKDEFYKNLHTAMDTIITLCDGIYVQPEGVEDYVMLDPQEIGEPVRFDDRLAVLVGMPEGSAARKILRKLFGNNDVALLNHAERLQRWMADTNSDLNVAIWQLGG